MWQCYFAGEDPAGERRSPDMPTPEQHERVLLYCTCGALRAAVAVPRDWERLSEADLRRHLEQGLQLRERGRG